MAKSGPPRPLVLESYSPAYNFFTTPVSSRATLARHGLYVATVRGTVSFYEALDYVAIQLPWHLMCGASQPAPMFSSAGGSGRVGNDAEFVFAQPLIGSSCATVRLPRRYTNFQASLGSGWKHPNVLSRRTLAKPSPSHTYAFALTGEGRPVSFRLIDPVTRDDYGSLRIYLRRAVNGDCAGLGYKAFGVSRGACLAATAGAPRAPRLPVVPTPPAIDQAPVAHVLRNSDVPTSVNRELPSGALSASAFAKLDTPTASAALTQTALLQSDGFRSAAISEFARPGLPWLKSTAVELSSPPQALGALAGEVALAGADQAPVGAAVAAGPDPDLGQAFIVTFTPTAGGAGGLELLASAGDYVYTLRAVSQPDTVSRVAEEQLLGTLIARG